MHDHTLDYSSPVLNEQSRQLIKAWMSRDPWNGRVSEPMFFVLFLLVGLVAGYMEYSGKFNAPYSKFRYKFMVQTKQLPTRRSLILVHLFTLGFVTFAYLALGTIHYPYHVVTYLFHFVKCSQRLFETLLIDKHSNPTISRGALAFILSEQIILAGFNCYSVLCLDGDRDGNLIELVFPTPLVAFALGAGIYHHRLLAKLRRRKHEPSPSQNRSRPYRIPKGGLFVYTTCPHYFFELLSWLGFSMIAHRPTVYGQTLYIGLSMYGRAYQTRNWYRNYVTNGYPTDRTCLIPFIS